MRSTTSCSITDEALEAAVSLSARYINDRFLPDKAIDLMDEAASRVRMETEELRPGAAGAWRRRSPPWRKDKEAAIDAQDYEKAAKLRDIEKDYREQVELERETPPARIQQPAPPGHRGGHRRRGGRLDRHPGHPPHRGRGPAAAAHGGHPPQAGGGPGRGREGRGPGHPPGPGGSEGPQAPHRLASSSWAPPAWARRSCASPWPRPCSAMRTP